MSISVVVMLNKWKKKYYAFSELISVIKIVLFPSHSRVLLAGKRSTSAPNHNSNDILYLFEGTKF